MGTFRQFAGTYSPFMLVNLRGPWGWSLFAVIWTLTFAGIALRLLLKAGCTDWWCRSTSPWAGQWWWPTQPMLERVTSGGLMLLDGGGLAYTADVIFYKWRRLPYNYAIWHGFVLAGATLHFFAVLFYVIPWPVAN